MLDGVRRLGVAVSGGGDSVALLHLLVQIAPRFDAALTVIHLDHGLRGDESRQDARFVASLAATLGLRLESRAVDLRHAPGNLEQAGREARRRFFAELIARGAVGRVATGHTRSDQAETVAFRLLRGAGLAGLAGILPVTADGVVRPLIDLSRQECRDYLAARGLPWRDDSSNLDQTLARNRIRHSLLPALARDWNPEIEASLARLAGLASEEEAYWTALVADLADSCFTADGAAIVLTARLRDLPRALSRRLLREALRRVRGGLRRVDFEHVEAVLDLAAAGRGAGGVRLPGVVVRRSFDWIRIAPAGDAARPYSESIGVPGSARIPGAAIRLDLVDYSYNTDGCYLDWSRVRGPLILRSWRPGDRFQPAGTESPRKVKELFQQARVPSWERFRWPMITTEGAILWTRRFGAAAGVAATPATRQALRVSEEVEG